MDGSPPGSSGDLVAKSCPTLATPRTVACQAPLSMGFLRQEYWSGWPFPSAGDLPDPESEPASPTLEDGFFTASSTFNVTNVHSKSFKLLTEILVIVI